MRSKIDLAVMLQPGLVTVLGECRRGAAVTDDGGNELRTATAVNTTKTARGQATFATSPRPQLDKGCESADERAGGG